MFRVSAAQILLPLGYTQLGATLCPHATQHTYVRTHLARSRKHNTKQHEHEQLRALSSWSSRLVRKASANLTDRFAFVRRLLEVKVKKCGNRKISVF